MKKPKPLHCLRCGHKWTSRIISKPHCCPRCKRYDWGSAKAPFPAKALSARSEE